MDSNKDKKFAPVRPYDKTLEDHWAMYDRMPYQRDSDICSEKDIALESGNLIKAYRCLFADPLEIKVKQSLS